MGKYTQEQIKYYKSTKKMIKQCSSMVEKLYHDVYGPEVRPINEMTKGEFTMFNNMVSLKQMDMSSEKVLKEVVLELGPQLDIFDIIGDSTQK